jgi:hypothetical protein
MGLDGLSLAPQDGVTRLVCEVGMVLDTLSPEEKTELDLLEKRLKKRARIARFAVIIILAATLGTGAWLASGVASYSPPAASPLEQLLTQEFQEVQFAWFDTISSTSRVNASMAADKQAKYQARAEAFLASAEAVDASLKAPLAGLLETMGKQNQMTLLEEEQPADTIRAPVALVNDALAKLSPRFYLEVDNFEGLLNDQYLMGVMVVVYEVLGTQRFSGGEGPDGQVEMLVVRRRDSLPAEGAAHGYARRDDTTVAFVLQDAATQFAASTILPSFERPDAAFELRFEKRVPDRLKPAYRVLVELVHLELRTLSGLDDAAMKVVAGNVAKRARIFKRASEAAAKHGVELKLPDGLVWPPSFASRVLLENSKLHKRGEKLLYDADKDDLIQITRTLDTPETIVALNALAQGIARSVGFHEARHVLDIRGDVEAGECIRDRVQITDGDQDFLRTVELEARSRLTELIEAPETVRLSLLSLVSHMYSRNGTANFYAARTLLHALAFAKDEEGIPRGWDYLEELTLRLGAASPEEIAKRSRAFYETCFGPYVPLQLVLDDHPEPATGGCSLTGL